MTDKELLELAAKAAKLRISFDMAGKCWLPDQSDYPNHRTDWNPLTDEGDAFRLAVKLGIAPIQDLESKLCTAYWTDVKCCIERYGSDPYAATRRAIVRAASEIGKGV